MSKLILDDISNTPNAYIKVNENSRRIETSLENTLSRDGTTPNFMNADLDMNGYNILNQKNKMGLEGFTWRGPWVFDRFYDVGDAVFFNGSSYICVIAHTSVDFDADLLADKWNIIVTAEGSLPDQGGHLGHFLSTDGANASWVDVLTVADGIGSAATAVASLDAQLNPVAKSGDFNDLTNKPATPVNADWNSVVGLSQILNKPTIPAAQVNSDWNSVSGVSQILNKPSLAFVDLTTAQSIGGVKTFTSRIVPSSTQGILGTTTNDNAIAGSIGEFIISAVPLGSAVAMTNNVVANITSISLTAGDWDVLVSFSSVSTSSVSVSNVIGSASLTSLMIEPQARFLLNNPTALTYTNASIIASGITPMLRVSTASPLTVYYTASAGFSAGSLSIYGHIRARRIR